MEEQQNQQHARRRVRQQPQGASRPLPAVATPRTLAHVGRPRPASTIEKIKYTAVGGIGSSALVGLLGMHSFSAFIGMGVGIAAWTFSDEIRAKLERRALKRGSAENANQRPNWLSWEWWNAPRYPVNLQPQGEPVGQAPYPERDRAAVETIEKAPMVESAMAEEDALFTRPEATDTDSVKRFTVEQIVKHCTPNSYKIWVGRSLTKPGNPGVLISFYKQHFRFMGASQRGKSSMVAAFLDIVTRTHDVKHVRLVLLDKEDQTSNLFAHLPHVLKMKKEDGSLVKLHARNDDQVLEYLIQCVALMKKRYAMPKSQVLELPIILVYIEEFLALKNEFKSRVDRAKTKEAKERAVSDYATLVYCIEFISQMGLKTRVQLLLCAQVEYADDDFKEALVNVQCGFAFCVRPTAAQSAGFQNGELVRQNAKANKVGQAVVETPDCNDLVLSPDYDLEARLLAFEKMQMRQPEEPTHIEDYSRMRAQEDSSSYAQNEQEDVRAYGRINDMRRPPETAHTHSDERTYPLLTDEQITMFIGAYRASGNKDKSLAAAGANTRYRAHADEIIREHNLKREA